MLLVDTSRKFRKNPRFWEKNTSTNFQKFGDTSTKVPTTPAKNIPDWYIFQDSLLHPNMIPKGSLYLAQIVPQDS